MTIRSNNKPKLSPSINKASVSQEPKTIFFNDEETPQGMGQWDTPKSKTPNAYTPLLSRHRVNREMPWPRVKLETFGIKISLGTLRWGIPGGGSQEPKTLELEALNRYAKPRGISPSIASTCETFYILVSCTHTQCILNPQPHPPPRTFRWRR